MKKKTKKPTLPTFQISGVGLKHKTMEITNFATGDTEAVLFLTPEMSVTITGLPDIELKKIGKLTVNGVEFLRPIIT